MSDNSTEGDAMALLASFYDLSGGKLNEPVPVGEPGSTEVEAAAPRAGIDPELPNCDVAVRYLVEKDYIKLAEESPVAYTLTVPGMDLAKEIHGA